MNYNTTKDISIAERLIDQVIGQDHAVEIISQAARQKRSVLLIGEPGTGKSLLGAAMSELLSVEELEDVLVTANPDEWNFPQVQLVPAGEGENIVQEIKEGKKRAEGSLRLLFNLAYIVTVIISTFFTLTRANPYYALIGALVIGVLIWLRKYVRINNKVMIPKLIINNARKTNAPFIDATGSQAGALLGDVRHDPYQSGGIETSPHELIEVGAIHLANKGVLLIDEVATLAWETQQSLLTAFQEKQLAITGRSPGSSGSMVRSQPVPCEFLLVLAGNLQDVERMHPALRSRIRGYGYEVYTNDFMDDTPENRYKLAQFVAQEVKKDGRIPHFSREGVEEIICEATRRTQLKGKLTTRLRELGGLVRAAGDLAVKEGAGLVEAKHVQAAYQLVKSLEEQIRSRQADIFLGTLNEPRVEAMGKVSAISHQGDNYFTSTIITEIFPGVNTQGKINGLGIEEINVPIKAVLSRELGKELAQFEFYVQSYFNIQNNKDFLIYNDQTLAVTLALKSAWQKKYLQQDTAIIGPIFVNGDIGRVNNINLYLEEVVRDKFTKVIIPYNNHQEVIKGFADKVTIIPVKNFHEAWLALTAID